VATEKMDLADAEERLPETDAWVQGVMERLRPLTPLGPLDVLEVGAAQGRGLLALSRLGHRAAGVEPSMQAIEVASGLAERHQAELDIREGRCEDLPFGDGRFDVVLAFSVLEHVTDLHRSLGEIARVLKPGGICWFNTASAMSPFQEEIRFFPFFGWYPDRMKKAIMHWCVRNWPAAINHTEAPAVWWWTPRRARRWLGEACFDKVWDRWELRALQATFGIQGALIRAIATVPGARILGDMVIPGCAYAARKTSNGKNSA
jgi:SAM-dependent methyltransferase